MFDKTKFYIFSKSKYLDSKPLYPQIESDWVDECDNCEVTIENEYVGYIDSYLIEPEWCIEL